ncbi:MAG: serine/threonine protein kinase [Acidobacteria bacterium]|nr:MAG: serine/threonine protein kinase [Acidobacteriota bacterium]
MRLRPGTTLGAYEILAPLGKGGMGEVYRARDTKLDREVAIKVLPDAFAQDADRLARFEREALLASLNHPNIASIHGIEEWDAVRALALELVEEPTLAERIQDGPIPVEEILAIARQIAEALEAGHEAGVIHRDVKPANVKLKEDGTEHDWLSISERKTGTSGSTTSRPVRSRASPSIRPAIPTPCGLPTEPASSSSPPRVAARQTCTDQGGRRLLDRSRLRARGRPRLVRRSEAPRSQQRLRVIFTTQ